MTTPANRRVPFARNVIAPLKPAQITKTRTGSDNQNSPAQITHCSPRAIDNYAGPGAAQHLADVVRNARNERGKRMQLRRPSKTRSARAPMFDRVNIHLRRLSRRALNDLAKTGHPEPTLDALAAALAAYVWELCGDLVYMQEQGEAHGSSRELGAQFLDGAEAVERVTYSAARYALRTPGEHSRYMRDLQRRASTGGTKSKRKPEWVRDPTLLEKLARHDGKTIPQQAAAMGVSVSTIKRMRADLPEHLRRAADLSRELDQLFPKTS